jgi:hypothetical protein
MQLYNLSEAGCTITSGEQITLCTLQEGGAIVSLD